MNWLFFALLAPAISSTVNFLDKYIIRGQEVDYKGMPIFAAIASFSLGSLLWVKQGFPLPHTQSEVVVIFAGILAFVASVLYFKVVNSVAVSKIIILFQLTPIFILCLSSLFLREHLTKFQLLGFSLVILAALGLTGKTKRVDNGSGLPPLYFFLILTVDLIYATSSILLKYATENTSVSYVYIFQSWGMGVGAVALFLLRPSARKGFMNSIKYLKKWPLTLILLNEGIFNVGKLLAVEATSMNSVALVNVVGSTQVFFGILYGWILNKVSPQIFEEHSTRRGLLKEIVFATIMFVGVYFLY